MTEGLHTYADSEALPERRKEHALYRHYDTAGTLLYVGISLNAMARTVQHRDASRWYDESVRMEIQRFPSRRDLLLAEREAIRKEKPKYNIHLVVEEEELPVSRYPTATETRIALLRKIVEPVYREENLLNALDITSSQLDGLIKDGHIRFFLTNGGFSKTLGTKRKRRVFTGWAVLGLLDALESGVARLTDY